MSDIISNDERRTLSVIAFLLLRMGLTDRARRVYDGIIELSEPGSSDWRFAKAGLASVLIEMKKGSEALSAVKAAMDGTPLTSREAALYLLKAQALWQQGRKEEARAARDHYLYLTGGSAEGSAVK